MVVCARCGYGYYGIRAVEQRRKTAREYRYYRCRGSDASRQGEGTDCPNRAVYAGELEAAVWREVRQVLEQPERLAAEYQRRLEGSAGHEPQALEGACVQLERARAGVARLIDGYAEGLLTKEEFTPRLTRLRQRVAVLEEQLAQQRTEQVTTVELHRAIGRLEEFATRVRGGLDSAARALQRELILALVRRVDVDEQQIRVVFKVSSPLPGNDSHVLRHCSDGAGRLAALAGMFVRDRGETNSARRPEAAMHARA